MIRAFYDEQSQYCLTHYLLVVIFPFFFFWINLRWVAFFRFPFLNILIVPSIMGILKCARFTSILWSASMFSCCPLFFLEEYFKAEFVIQRLFCAIWSQRPAKYKRFDSFFGWKSKTTKCGKRRNSSQRLAIAFFLRCFCFVIGFLNCWR